MILKIQIHDFPDEAAEYLEACARIRNMGRSIFIRTLLEKIAEDQMVLAIMDDNSVPVPRPRLGTHKHHPWNKGRSP